MDSHDDTKAGKPGYVAKLAHELKTPLTAIAAAADVMRQESLGPLGNPRYREYATDIHESARHILDVIDRMLTHRSAEPSGAQLEFSQVDVTELVEGCVSAIAPLASQDGLTLRSELQPHLPHVIADTMSLKQMLLNLLTNALKFTPAGGVIIVSTHCELNGSLSIEVDDTGQGMSTESLAKVLGEGTDPSDGQERSCDTETELRPATGALSGGLGIGLALVQSLAEANGAKLTLASRENEGTTVAIVFPKDRVVPV